MALGGEGFQHLVRLVYRERRLHRRLRGRQLAAPLQGLQELALPGVGGVGPAGPSERPAIPLTSSPKAGKIIHPNTKTNHQKPVAKVSKATPPMTMGMRTARLAATWDLGLILSTSSPKKSSESHLP